MAVTKEWEWQRDEKKQMRSKDVGKTQGEKAWGRGPDKVIACLTLRTGVEERGR